MRFTTAAFIAACLLPLQGCVSAAISVASLAGSAALEKASQEPVHVVVPAPLAGVRLAALKTVERLAMKVETCPDIEDQWMSGSIGLRNRIVSRANCVAGF